MDLTYERVDIGGKPHWRFSDGKTLPVVAGGSDAGLGTPPPPVPGVDPTGQTLTYPTNVGYLQTPPPVFGSAPPNAQTIQLQPGQRFFTEEDVARIRTEEKDKLYPELEKARARAAELEAKEAEFVRLAQEEQAVRDAEAQRLAEENMSARELIEARDREWEQRFSALQTEQARKDAMYNQERRFQQLQTYKAQVLAANANEILPELQDPDMVHGESEDEINNSVATLVAKSASVLQNFRSLGDEQMRTAPLVSPTSPGVGPMEMGQQFRTLSAEQIAAMPMAEYQKIRQYLPTGQADRGDRGMWG